MAEKPPSAPVRGNTPAGPKVSGARTVVSLVLLVLVLVVCVIEVRAGLGQFLTLKAFNDKSENNLFNAVSLAEAQGMIAMFPSSPVITQGELEDTYHYQWYSLLRPLAGKDVPELYVAADHSDPPQAVSFYTSVEGEPVHAPYVPTPAGQSTSAPGMPMGGMPMGGHDGPGGFGPRGGGGPGGGPGGGGPGGPRGDGRERPAMEDEEPAPAATEPAATEPAATEPAATEPAATEPAATEPAAEPTKSDESPAPAADEPGDAPKADEDAAPKSE